MEEDKAEGEGGDGTEEEEGGGGAGFVSHDLNGWRKTWFT